MSSQKMNIKLFILLQLTFCIFSLTFVFSKKASFYSLAELQFFIFLGLEFLVLVIYALMWQQVLKRIQLSIAYLNKGVVLLWSIVWSIIFFGEKITGWNIVGILLIFIGVSVVNKNE